MKQQLMIFIALIFFFSCDKESPIVYPDVEYKKPCFNLRQYYHEDMLCVSNDFLQVQETEIAKCVFDNWDQFAIDIDNFRERYPNVNPNDLKDLLESYRSVHAPAAVVGAIDSLQHERFHHSDFCQ